MPPSIENISLLLILLACFLLAHTSTIRSPDQKITSQQATQLTGSAPQQSPCFVLNTDEDVTVNCQGRSLTRVDMSWFPENTTVILLDNNLLTAVPKIFETLHRLRRLSLSGNQISDIQDNMFLGLGQLEYLNLDDNPLNVANLSKETLAPLKSLIELSICIDGDFEPFAYPNETYSRLLKLQVLTISAFGEELYFGEEFGSTTNVHQLTIIQGNVQRITKNSFKNVNRIRTLEINNLSFLNGVENSTFESLKHVNQLTLKVLRLELKELLPTFKAFVGKKMDSITMMRIRVVMNDRYNTILTGDAILTQESLRYLTQICVAHFALTDSNVYVIKHNAFASETWNKCLKSLDLSKNLIAGTKFAYFQIWNLKHLETLIMEYSTPFYTGSNSVIRQKGRESCNIDKNSWVKQSNSYVNEHRLISNTKLQPRVSEIFFYTSSSLQLMDFAKLVSLSFDINLTFVGAENLCYVDLSYSRGRRYTCPIRGLNNVKTFILTGNNIIDICGDFFDTMPSIETLDLSRNQLQNGNMFALDGRLFQKLFNLKQLELSFNHISALSSNIFHTNKKLEELYLAWNRFSKMPLNLKNTPSLRVLDLRFNALITLPKESRDEMDTLARNNGGFSLYLEGNVLSCGCQNIQFLQWIKLTSVSLDMWRNFTCIDNDGVSTNTGAYTNLEAYWRQCWGNFFLSFSVILFCLLVIGFVLCYFIIMFKTYIMSGLMNLFNVTKLKSPSSYEIGVFIGYADRDYQFACHDLREFIEVTLGLQTYIRDRDLSPNANISSGIMNAIDDSWRILLVVNETFLNSDD
ncbi:toll-like receptor 4 [Physella acuta]|uniref:toll-like receptor 4 n=1 Tax=Physella acuta TaxID=109671 RepID=UPI0027DD67F1|nr:toll-like receptor 4 [Physella acuta]